MELFLYRRSTRVVTVTKSFKEHVARRGIDAGKIGVVTNGVDLDRFAPGPRDEAFARAKGLDEKFVVLYLGAHGISHALSRILDAAERMRDDDGVRFVFVGEGAEKDALVANAKRRGLGNVVFEDGVSKDEVLRWYRLADVGLVPLRDVPLFATFIPSKMFELLACGLPVVGSVAGEAAEILESSGGARVVPPEDVDAIVREIRALRDDAGLRRRLGEAGRRFVAERYSRRKLAADYLAILESMK
jgi:glycosyltransferase involved in cell wall biosynthesis